ncbi:hypothetical protein [Streptomyces sp. SID5910]|uniref:hypothetical protein n=1 Tax=Streptomyces sp. SID5910 TaxID=2690312 RepID=UPI0013708E2D|nr:hypothetical protein [Streptomyces sp. SID5910]MYR40760.1 hypothetical protein [Streptomyces sp. SID5910]
MGLLTRLTGTRYAAADTVRRPAEEVRAALLGLDGEPDVPFRVRAALPDERADLVAECAVPRVGVRLRTRLRLVPDRHEVRFLDERWETRPSDGTGARYGRGHAPAVYRQWSREAGPDGRRRRVETFRFDTRELTDPLRDTVLGAGWTWRGVFRL